MMKLISMTMKFFKIQVITITILFFTHAPTWADSNKDNTSDKVDSIEEFKETRQIIIDKIFLPKELKIIEEEVSQNAIDVIILSGTHNLVFNAQFNENGHLKTFKNFYSLKIEINEHPTSDGFFLLRLYYYNWLTKKEDHRLIRKISKYNVLNELRMNLYQLFKGKNFVETKKESLEKSNYERIQAVAQSIEEKKRKKKIKEKIEAKKITPEELEDNLKKKKDKDQLIKREEDPKIIKTPNSQNVLNESSPPQKNNESEEIKNSESLLSVKSQIILDEKEKEEFEKKSKKRNKKLEINEEPQALETTPPPISSEVVPEISSPNIPRISHFHFFSGYHFENVYTSSIIKTTTNPKYIIIGAHYENIQDKAKPSGFEFDMRAGIPIGTAQYQVPVYREIQTEYFYKDLIPMLTISAGLDISPIYFVNLPELGKDLQIFENDVYWAKIGLKLSFQIYDKIQKIGMYVYKDLVFKSNFEKKMTATKSKIYLTGKIATKYGYTFETFSSTISGNITGNLRGYFLGFNYYFGDN